MTSSSSPPNLLTIILDITTFTWTHRSLARTAKDKALSAKNKPSAGPATLDDVLTSVLALGMAFACLDRNNVLVVVGVTEEEVGVLYPRKGGEGSMEEVVSQGGGGGGRGERVDTGLLNDYVRLGVAELVNRSAARAEKRAEQSHAEGSGSAPNNGNNNSQPRPAPKNGAAIASALSLALCTINRFMVSSNAGVSALATTSSLFQRNDDEGVLALMGNDGGSKSSSSQGGNAAKGALSSRALIVQASPDRTSDYNALMNCAFAANKSDVVIDGCFIPSGMKDDDRTSPYLEQLVDQTRGVYLSVPSGAAQVGGALTEVLMSVFLPPPSIRGDMNLPRLHDVDFRARCFETGESIDVAQICNRCLSIFKDRPKDGGRCLTCGAVVRSRKVGKKNDVGVAKKMKLK